MEVPQIQFLDDEMVGYWWGLVSGSTVDTWSCVSSWVLLEGVLREEDLES